MCRKSRHELSVVAITNKIFGEHRPHDHLDNAAACFERIWRTRLLRRK